MSDAPQSAIPDPIGRASRTAAVLSLLGAAIVFGSLWFSADRLWRMEKKAARLAASTQQLETRRDVLSEEIRGLSDQLEKKMLELNAAAPFALSGLGHREVTQQVAEAGLSGSVRAAQRAEALSRDGAARRANVAVRYYPRDFERELNAAVVLPRLSSFGFRLDRRAQAKLSDVPTNAIWCGRNVAPEDVKIVALTLVAAGLEIKAIREFRDPTGPKRGAIEIGGDRSFVNAASLSYEQIAEATDFRRPD